MQKDNKNNNKDILKEFIDSVILKELEGGENQLYKAFIQPFVDVGKTAAYGLETLSAQVQTVVKGFFLGLFPLFVPFIEYDFKTFQQQEKEKLGAVRKKYEKVLESNLEAIQSNDAFGLAFLLAPGVTLAGQLATKTPAAALRILELLVGGSPLLAGVRNSLNTVSGMGFHDPGGGNTNYGPGGGDYDFHGGGDDMGYGGIYEEAEPTNPDATREIQKLLKNKEFIKQVEESDIAKQMHRDAVKILLDHIKKFTSLNDYNKMRRLAKGDVGFAAIGQKLKELNQTGQVPPENNPTITAALIPELKKNYKAFWIKQFQQLINHYPEARVELVDGIKQIRTLT